MIGYSNEHELSFEELLKKEMEIAEEQVNRIFASQEVCVFDDVLKREAEIFNDKEYNLPQNIFLIKFYNGITLAGRKLPSVLFMEKKINAINCSMITADMLLGILHEYGQDDKDVWIKYYPFNRSEKVKVFDNIKHNPTIEILYPFLYKEFQTGLEKVTGPDGWDISPEKATYLGYGEEHLREYSISVLKDYLMSKKAIVFDPACSTGEYLYSLKKVFPFIKTIGQDLSKSMVAYARNRVDEIYCGDSINSLIEDSSIDILVFRFLNSEVVSKEYSIQLFNSLIKKIKPDGIAVLFGHTAVLLDTDFFKNAGYNVIQSTGYSNKRDAIFQYYIIEPR